MLQVQIDVSGGTLSVMTDTHARVCLLIFASTCPGGALTAERYAQLKHQILSRLESCLPFDGVLLPLHGAAAVLKEYSI